MVAISNDSGGLQFPIRRGHARCASTTLPIKNTFIHVEDEEPQSGTIPIHSSGAATWCVQRLARRFGPHEMDACAGDTFSELTPRSQGTSPEFVVFPTIETASDLSADEAPAACSGELQLPTATKQVKQASAMSGLAREDSDLLAGPQVPASSDGELKRPITSVRSMRGSAISSLLVEDECLSQKTRSLPIKNTFIHLGDDRVGGDADGNRPSGAATWCVERMAVRLPVQERFTPIVECLSPESLATPSATRTHGEVQPSLESESNDPKEEDHQGGEGFFHVLSIVTGSPTMSACRSTGDLSSCTFDHSAPLDTVASDVSTGRAHCGRHASTPTQISPSESICTSMAETDEANDPRDFVVILHKTMGAPMGIDVDHRGNDSLRVCNIFGGCMQAWNHEHPDQEVKVGDLIVEVNGVCGHPCALINECWKNDQILRVRIRRPDSGLSRQSPSQPGNTCTAAKEPRCRPDSGRLAPAQGQKKSRAAAVRSPAACKADACKAGMVCRHWEQKGWCRYLERCAFSHPDHKRGGGTTLTIAVGAPP